MPKGWKPPSDNSDSFRDKVATPQGTMPKGWKSPANDDTVFFSSESLLAGSETLP
jgi:hypothetical protein